MVTTLVVIAILAHSSRKALQTIAGFELRELAVERVAAEIRYLDEVLTMSARLCAATGDVAWEARYLDHVALLDETIARAHALAPEAEEHAGSKQTEAANAALVDLELASFELVHAGRAAEALQLLLGEEYEHHKGTYSSGLELYLQTMHGRVSATLAAERARARRNGILLLVAVPLLLLQWALVARSIRAHIRRRRRVEARLIEHAFELERRNEEVRQADQAKSEFLARMSHEIRTPMNGVLGAAELLADSGIDAGQAELIGVVRSSGLHLLSVIDDILDISKIEAGRLEIAATACNPAEVVAEVARMLQPRAGEKGVTLAFSAAEDVPESVLLDSLRLRQVLVNLVGNALKFTARGGVSIRLELDPRASAGGWPVALVFRVQDSGIGIAADRIERIFEGFVQADPSITRRFGGTGLGLTISRQLVQLMGGTIGVTSEEGLGTEFRVVLPAAPAPAAVLPHKTVESAAPPALRGRILVAEDNAVNQLVIRRRIERLGLEVDVVGNGRECLRAFEQRRYDFVFMDCHMPEMDGFEATRAIRALEAGKARLPIVALTASAFPGDVEACRRADMDDFVSKPFTDARLRDVLDRWLRPAQRALS